MPTLAPQIEFYSATGGDRLAFRRWSTTNSPAARVVFLHGITSHGGWYDQSAAHLASAGFEVSFLDRRGSGLNATHIADVPDWRVWVDDVAAFIDPTVPTLLCGISWGGKLAAAVARTYPGLFAGIAFICPGLYSPFMPGMFKRLALRIPAPKRLQHRRMPIPLDRCDLFTDTLKWREFIATDPLALRAVTYRCAQQDSLLTKFARESPTFLHMPALVMLAGQDRIVNNDRTRDYFARLASSHKVLIEYGQSAHTLEFENDPTPYFADLAGWVRRVVTLPI